jgi:hypothetical protein
MALTENSPGAATAPTDFAGWQAAGIRSQESEQFEAAAHAFQQCIELDTAAASAWSNLSLAFRGLYRYPEALRCAIHATRLDPNWHTAWINLSSLCGLMALYEQALDAAEWAVKLKPDRGSAWGALGNALRFEGRLDETLAAYDRGLMAAPNQASLHWNRAEALLMKEDWARGFEAYEWRHRRPGYSPLWWGDRLWSGERTSGTLLLHAEQGFGDALQFARFVRLAKERVGCVVLSCHPRLMGLLSTVEGVDEVVSKHDPAPDFDWQHFMMSVPSLLQVTEVSVSAPYLKGGLGVNPPAFVRSAGSPAFKVGLGWQGNPEFGRDHLRSIPLSRFKPLADLPDLALYSLQKEDGSGQIPTCGFDIVDSSESLDSGASAFVDTIEAMLAVDLVITTDTSLAHLAGALGVEVWLLLSYAPDWRWGLNSQRSAWYPSMRLFRQSEPVGWEGVIEQVAGALRFRQFRLRWGGDIEALAVARTRHDRLWAGSH